jgi:RecA-family ATPase
VIVEGEKDADALWKLNIPATTNAGGAGKWSPALNEFFREADIIIIPDNDPPAKNPDGTLRLNAYGKPTFPGQDHARAMARSLGTLPRSVRVLELPGLPLKGDASDWLANGTADEFWRLVETAAVAWEVFKGPSEELPSNPGSIIPLETFDAGDWEGVDVEPRPWLVQGRIPLGEVGIVSGDGGTGKTMLMLQLAVAVSAERPDWLNAIVETHGPALVFSAEEKIAEMRRRVDRILAHYDLTFAAVRGRLHFICDPDDAALATVNKDGLVQPTQTLLRLEKTVERIKPALIVIENAAEVYPASEVIRSPISRFVRKLLGGLTRPSGASLALIQHPSVAGLQDGSGRSGTTGWNNAGRWRLNFTTAKSDEVDDPDLRVLEVVKSNYGRKGEKVRVRWTHGVFVPAGAVSDTERSAAAAPIDSAFLRCLAVVTAQGRFVSPNPSTIWAPAVFEGMQEADGLNRKAFAAAMERLLAGDRIRVETTGSESRRRQRITLPTPLPTPF